ncbi:MAG: hypothetical protein JXA99_04435 [Candidatus Lokiarchaeota archaeon]|nr:hypothetical protein [Candidatus Lokiarchaeota archaeon]
MLLKVYPKVLGFIIRHVRKNSLLILCEDSDNRNTEQLYNNWKDNTENFLFNPNNFQKCIDFNIISNSNINIDIGSNNLLSSCYHYIPKSLEYQIAYINMIENNLNIPNNIQNNHHDFLNKVVELLDQNHETLIRNSVNLLRGKQWLVHISNSIMNFISEI